MPLTSTSIMITFFSLFCAQVAKLLFFAPCSYSKINISQNSIVISFRSGGRNFDDCCIADYLMSLSVKDL